MTPLGRLMRLTGRHGVEDREKEELTVAKTKKPKRVRKEKRIPEPPRECSRCHGMTPASSLFPVGGLSTCSRCLTPSERMSAMNSKLSTAFGVTSRVTGP